MAITVHHRPADPGKIYNIHVWDASSTWEPNGKPGANGIDFVLPDVPDPRKLQFLFRTTDRQTHQDVWEPDSFIRRIRLATSTDIWSFDAAARILYQDPAPPGVYPVEIEFRKWQHPHGPITPDFAPFYKARTTITIT